MKLEGISVKLICDICNLTFTDSSFFADHCKSAHPLSPSSHTVCFVCHVCSDTFETDVELRSHIHVKHVFDCIDVKPETSKEEVCQNCKFCGRIFRHPAILSMHSESCRKLHEQFFNGYEFCDYVSFDHSIEEPSSFIVGTKYRNVARRGSHNSSYCGLKGRICVPSGKGGLTCKLCKKKFSKKSDLNIHVNNCSLLNQNKDNCVINGDKSQNLNRAVLFKNMQSKMGLKDERVACAYCMKSFNSKFDAILHVRKIHSAKVDEFIVWLERRKVFLRSKMCSWCDKVFQNKEEADEHFRSLHKEENEEKDWSCELCLMKLNNESELINHIADNGACIKELKSRHVDSASEELSNGDEMSLALDNLEFQVLNVHALKVDQEVTESKLGQENSESAGKQNCDVGEVLMGVTTGEPDGPISADMLSESFCTPDFSDPCVSGLGDAKFDIEEDSQISIQHTELFSPTDCVDSIEETPYVCDACGKTFKGKASLFIHRKSHKDHFRYPCEYCQKKFRWRRQLLKHLTVHKDEKRHYCRICGKGFAFRISLTKHRRIHTKVKPFKCHVCSLLFGQEQYLLNHLKYQHGIQQFQSIEEMQE